MSLPPPETPGPSVSAPRFPESDAERRERADAMRPEPDPTRPVDPIEELIAEEESAAAAEAAGIGWVAPRSARNPAMAPVYEAGGGEQDGWEQAEADLIANATHADGHGNPTRDAFTPEVESDRSDALYGEADRLASTEVRHDPDAGPDDPMDGDPNLSADRGPSRPPDLTS